MFKVAFYAQNKLQIDYYSVKKHSWSLQKMSAEEGHAAGRK